MVDNFAVVDDDAVVVDNDADSPCEGAAAVEVAANMTAKAKNAFTTRRSLVWPSLTPRRPRP
jgi:hypothetical protein